jgi:hypothetical protein
MALMIPETIPDTATDTERRVFNALRRSLSDDCIVWYELPLPRQGRSALPDFVVIGPHIGLAVLEVKGWQIWQIAEATKRHFRVLQCDQLEEKPNPLLQARHDVHTAIDLLKATRDPLLVLQEGDRAGQLRFPYAAVVAMPRIRRVEFERHGLNQILQSDEVLLHDDLEGDLEQRLREMRLFPGEMTPPMIDAVRRILHPEVIIHIARPSQGQLPLLDLAQEQIVKSHVQLTREGQALVRDLDARLVRGVVGSGKTLILLYRAKFLSEINPAWRVLVLTYTRTLAKYLRGRLLEIGGDPKRVEITTFHKWCKDALSPSGRLRRPLDESSQQGLVTRILKDMPEAQSFDAHFLVDEINWMKDHRLVTWNAYGQAPRRGRGVGLSEVQRRVIFSVFEAYQQRMAQARQLDWGDMPLRVLEALDAETLTPAQYHAILVDEAQDFAPTWFQIALRLLKPETNQLFIVADGAQKIYRRAFSWASLGIDIRGSRSRLLTRSYRNTFEILATAYQVIRDGNVRQELETGGEEVIEPEMVRERMPRGPLPVLLQFADPASEYAHLVAEIQQLLNGGFRLADILVAGRRRSIVHKLAETLYAHSLPVSVMTQTAGLDDSSIKVSTLHGAKGLEFPVVFICGLEALSGDREGEHKAETVEAEERRLLYVGMTRARERLYVSYHGQVPAWVLEALETGIESGEAKRAEGMGLSANDLA